MKKYSLLIITTLLLSSCATIFTGTKDTIRFQSEPTGAKVYIDGLLICTTPCSMPIKRHISEKVAEIKLKGYQTKLITLDSEFNVISVINLGNIIAWAIDIGTGSVKKYTKKSYDIELEKDKSTSMLDNPVKIEIDTKGHSVGVYVAEH